MLTRPRPMMFTVALAAALTTALAAGRAEAQTPASIPQVGEQAPVLTVKGLEGEPVDLGAFFASGKTVLVVLRGYPGYQCGICTRQATGFISSAKKFEDAGLNVVMVYPGEAEGLAEHAEEFLAGRTLPAPITMVIDPDFELVDRYGLRWEAPNETAYPATFVIKDGEITYAEISDGHAGRVEAKDALAAATE